MKKLLPAILIAVIVSAFAGALLGATSAAHAQTATSATNPVDQATLLTELKNLEGQLTMLQFKVAGCSLTFNTNLSQGMTDPAVHDLQVALNYGSLTRVAAVGAGSPGNETNSFGPATAKAVINFQNIFASDILTPNGLTAGTGYVGAATRAELNALCTGNGANGTSGTSADNGTGGYTAPDNSQYIDNSTVTNDAGNPNASVDLSNLTQDQASNIATLYITFAIDNSTGGSGTANDFRVTFTGSANPSPSAFPGTNDGTQVVVTPNVPYGMTIVPADSAASQYQTSFLGDCSSTTGITPGQQGNCTVVETYSGPPSSGDQSGTTGDTGTQSQTYITILVYTDNAGPAVSSNFNLTVNDGGTVLSAGPAPDYYEQFYFTTGDTYSVTESKTSTSQGYTISYSSGCSGVAGTDPINCTITNTYNGQ